MLCVPFVRRRKTQSSQFMRMKKQSHDRFYMAAARRCQVVASPNVSPWLFPRIPGFKGSTHVPRTSAGARTCAVVYMRVPCGPRGGEHERRTQRPEEKKMPKCERMSILYLVHSNIRSTCRSAADNRGRKGLLVYCTGKY